jgi:hypothetical protein
VFVVKYRAAPGDPSRCIQGDAIMPRPIRTMGSISRWCRRNPALTTSITVTVLAVVVAVALTVGYVKTSVASKERPAARRDLELAQDHHRGPVREFSDNADLRSQLETTEAAIEASPPSASEAGRKTRGSSNTGAKSSPDTPPIIRNMPTNSEKRCMGISVVAEALLDGERVDRDGVDGGDAAEELARRIYRSLVTRRRVQYRPRVTIGNKSVPIDSKGALERLSTLVADLYKRDYVRLLQTEEGQQRLIAAQTEFIGTRRELDRILDADPDKTDVFCVSGRRWFPDGSVKETHHVVLIAKKPDGTKVVYYPNDPGSAIPCRLRNGEDVLEIVWTCRYRDTGHVTTQRYNIVHKDRFFRVALGVVTR